MRILFMGDDGLSLAKISVAFYREDDKSLWFSIDDSTLEKSELVVENITPQIAEEILRELLTTQMFDFSSLGLHVEIC